MKHITTIKTRRTELDIIPLCVNESAAFSQPMRWLARLVLFIISFVWYSPHVYASIQKLNEAPALNLIENYYPLGAELEKLRSQLSGLLAQLEAKQSSEDKSPVAVSFSTVEKIRGLDEAQRAEMTSILAHLKSKKQSAAILDRQSKALSQYETDMNALFASLESIKQSESAVAQKASIQNALSLLDSPLSRPHESLSNDLDFFDPPPRDIYSSLSQIQSLLGADAGNYTATDSATRSSTAITAKVAELGTDPLTLYQWVHDTVRWIPSYGVMQGADYTLQAEQGNAFDTSSLLISLLRAAGHEARYRYGIVQMPVEQMRNWIGNVKNADAAANLISQGGVPHTQISYGGAVEEIRLEHVWVEVREGTNWRALDPSFKQYSYTEGMDLQSAVSFDANALLTQLEATSTHNEAEGWIQGVNATLIETALNGYQTQLETHLSTQAPNATLGDVLGMQTIIPDTATQLSQAAPTYTTVMSHAVAQLPDSLFHRFRVQLGSAVSYDLGASFNWGSQLFQLNERTTELVGKDIAISFRPATPADEAAIESYLPDTINSVEDLPSSLPASAIQMVAELTVDGTVRYSSSPMGLGEALKARLGFQAPQRSYEFTENNLIAGQYQAIGIDMQGLSPKQLEALQAKLENTQTQLAAENYSALTKHDVVGNILQAGVQGYLAMTYATDRIAAQAAGVVYFRQPSYGTFGTMMEVSYLLGGIPNSVQFSGVGMDIDRLQNNVEEKKNCYEGFLAFNRASGMRSSAFEHQVPEQLFSTTENPAQGVSTAKALAIAMAQGQRIYTLTQANSGQLSNITIDAGARAEIQAALSQGLEVTVHQNPISVSGWTGSGYSIIDAEYGVGAYKISGGASGGFVAIILSTLGGFFDGQTYWERAIDEHKSDAARKAGTYAKFLAIVEIALSMKSFLEKPSLGGLVELLLNVLGMMIGNASGAWLVSAFGTVASPIFVGLLVAMWAFVLAILLSVLIDLVVSGVSISTLKSKDRDSREYA